jgi:hypothetical protein
MPTFGEGVRGIEDLRIAPLVSDVPGDNTDIVGVKGFSVESTSDTDEQIGDEEVLFTVQENKKLTVTVMSALANLAAIGVATGVAPLTSGTTPTRVTTWESPSVANTQYVQLTGQSRGRDVTGSAFRLTVLKAALVNDPSWNMEQGAWLEPEMEFTGVARDGYLLRVQTLETLEAIPEDGSIVAGD